MKKFRHALETPVDLGLDALRNSSDWIRTSLLFLLTLASAGCQRTDSSIDTSANSPIATGETRRPLRVLVVEDVPLAEVARREWLAVSDSQLDMTNISLDEFREQLASGPIAADVLIYPSAWLGSLVEAKLIVAVPQHVRDSERYAEKDILPWVRRGEITWGEQPYAVPLGSVTFTMVSRAERENVDALWPRTWAELAAWKGGKARVAQPLAEGWAVHSHLARAAAYVRSRGQVSTLFDFRTMQPLIDSPPFVRALEELVASTRSVPEQIDWTPWDVQQALLDGRCDVGITWMSAGAPLTPAPVTTSADASTENAIGESKDSGLDWHFNELPGSRNVYRTSENDWGPQGDKEVSHVPLIGLSGRVGSVLARSRRQQAGWKFLAALSGEDFSLRVSAASRHTGPFRFSHQAARPWMVRQIGSADAREFGIATNSAYSRPLALHALRIPGHEDYLRRLDQAVRAAVRGEGEPTDLLRQVAEDWQEITQSLGVENQRAAYERNLGMEPNR